MNKWSSSGRYGLTRGLKKRLWSFHNSFEESTGGDNKSRFLESGIGADNVGVNDLMTENSEYLRTEQGSLLEVN